ncbi:MAG: M15 family metallopeptidase [Phenylobacterium sp.]|uniref:M15 family metallopeptidase n=1 Tax=Phenylobacterium sp. TaxID=1871053 RepID=UPI00391A7FA3
MGYKLGRRSLANLEGVHPDLVAVVRHAINFSEQDFTVIEGVRTRERQLELYAQGRTKPGKIVTWTRNSRHFPGPDGLGRAVDIAPYPIDWASTPENLARFDAVAKAMFRAAMDLGLRIRWGADWDRDGKPREKGEHDSPHFELAD